MHDLPDTSTVVAINIPALSSPLRIFIHGPQDRHVSRRLREEGVWEPYETQLVLQLLNSGDVFVDVGANIGYFSLIAAAIVGASGAVYAFEPDPVNYQLFQASAELNGLQALIQSQQAGLAAAAGETQLFLSEDNLGDHQIFNVDSSRRSVPVALLHGSDHLSSRTSHIDLLKVDTQGAEHSVMLGLMPLLQAQHKPPCILIELTPLSLRQAGSSGRELVELLDTLGQPLWIVDHIEHRLVRSHAAELSQWCDDVDAVAGDQGFMNILVGPGM